MFDLRSASDVHNGGSFSNRMRSRRFVRFAAMLDATFEKPVSIIDFGGTVDFWRKAGWLGKPGVSITAVNLQGEPGRVENVEVVIGDATNLADIPDASFDVAFSNSVIEHLYTLDAQRRMASEMRRVAKAHWVQTPNFAFPMEPHFHVLGWQWLPRDVRVRLLRARRCGWRGPCPDLESARLAVDEVRLMTRREFRAAFPESHLWNESWMGLTKSFVAYGGFATTIDGVVVPERHRETSRRAA
ncbi:MAG: class I SAM-dependent methyltransferase [Phycisphaerales bacterium]